MSTPEQLSNLYKEYLNRKIEIKKIKRELTDELKAYEDQLNRFALDLGQEEMFDSRNSSDTLGLTR